MNETWKRIFNDYIEAYNVIQTLAKHNHIDADSAYELEDSLLQDIIETMKSEVEE